jgi:hypothetical protein
MSKILLNDFNNIYPLEKDLPQNKLNEQDIHPHSIDYQNKPRLASHNLED